MNTRRTSRKPASGSTPAAKPFVPSQAASPEQGAPAERLAYSVDEAARLTGLSRDLLYDEMRRGHLDYLKVGRRRLITRQHLERFLGITPGHQPSAPGATAGGRQAGADAR
jgi:excisionase family DNA binding protein